MYSFMSANMSDRATASTSISSPVWISGSARISSCGSSVSRLLETIFSETSFRRCTGRMTLFFSHEYMIVMASADSRMIAPIRVRTYWIQTRRISFMEISTQRRATG